MADDIDLTPPEFLRRRRTEPQAIRDARIREAVEAMPSNGGGGWAAPMPRTELTEAGEQYVIPGAEKGAPDDDKPYQPELFE